jgi:hypothetical protein
MTKRSSMKRLVCLLAVLALIAFALTAVVASVTFTPPGSNKPVRMGTGMLTPYRSAPKASGTATFMGNMDRSGYAMSLQISGLDPRKVYTVQFSKTSKHKGMKDVTTVNKPQLVLTVEKTGRSQVSQNFKTNPLLEWTDLAIIEHPDKNPRSAVKTVAVMTIDLYKLNHE